jgi:glycosyltransferase involved in cell wall biosynthesis
LASVQDIADEIVVVDSYSTDRTQEIAERYHAQFVQHPFEGHIEQKNWALTQASYDHVLSLDADEEVTPALKQSILDAKANWSADGYYFNRLTNFCGAWIHHCEWYPDRKLRLWDRRKGKWGGENPHDRFELEAGATKQFLQGDLLHYSFYTVDQHIAQINKFSSIAAQARFARGRKPSIVQLLLNPFWKFVRSYFLRGGFRDGYYGFVVCINSAHSTFLKHVKLFELWQQQQK